MAPPLAKFDSAGIKLGKFTGSGDESDDDTLLPLVSLTGMAEAGKLHKINARLKHHGGSGDDDMLLALVSLTGMAEAGALHEINAPLKCQSP